MNFDIITLFPDIFKSYLKYSILKKAQDKNILRVRIYNLRDFTFDKHHTVDDKPFGGGRGMVLKVGPVYRAVQFLINQENSEKGKKVAEERQKSGSKTKIILFSPRGKIFNQKVATRFSQLNRLILISGRYEGVDERVAKYIADEKISMGKYVLMGGDLPALALIEAVARLIPGVIGNSALLKPRITKENGFVEYPQYTRPETFELGPKTHWRVPKVLLSGNPKFIKEWQKKHSKIIA